MLREEEVCPAEAIIFNIFDDDHFRSLEGWMAFNWAQLAMGRRVIQMSSSIFN